MGSQVVPCLVWIMFKSLRSVRLSASPRKMTMFSSRVVVVGQVDPVFMSSKSITSGTHDRRVQTGSTWQVNTGDDRCGDRD